MNKYNKLFIFLTLQVIALFVYAIAMTYVSDFMRQVGFFNDVLCEHRFSHGMIDEKWDWGTRHYLWFWMSIILFFLGVFRIILWVENYGEKNNIKNI